MAFDSVQFETNVDDMDTRLWPIVIDRLLDVGADDAWVTPILMKKGRPAFKLGVLCGVHVADDVKAVIFRETTTIGLRQWPVEKHGLARTEQEVSVNGQPIRVKSAMADDAVINRSVEWDDVQVAASKLGLTAKEVLAVATAAAQELDS